jgi:hypothetical protein
MNYKQACAKLRVNLERAGMRAKSIMPVPEDLELLYELSNAQKYIFDIYKIKQKVVKITFDRVTNVYTLTDIKEVYAITYKEDYYTGVTQIPLSRTTEADVIANPSSYKAEKYYVLPTDNNKGVVVTFDCNMEVGQEIYMLVLERSDTIFDKINYVAPVGGSGDSVPTITSIDWNDYNITAVGYGGSLKLPDEFFEAAMWYALCQWYPENMQMFKILVTDAVRSFKVNVDSKLIYNLK